MRSNAHKYNFSGLGAFSCVLRHFGGVGGIFYRSHFFMLLNWLKLAFTYIYACACAYAGVNNQSERVQIHLHTYLYEKPRITTGLILRYYDRKKLFRPQRYNNFLN